MNATSLEMEIKLELPETPGAEAQQRIRTRIEAELAALFPETDIAIQVHEGSWELKIVLFVVKWVLDNTLGRFLQKKSEQLANGGRQPKAIDDRESSSDQLQPAQVTQDFAAIIPGPSPSFSTHGGELVKHLDNMVGTDWPPAIERIWTATLRDKVSGREESYSYTVSQEEHSITHVIKEPRHRREDPDNTIPST